MAIGTFNQVGVETAYGMAVEAPAKSARRTADERAIGIEENEAQTGSPVEGVKVARGLLGMLIVEAAAAICMYGLWEALHLIRAAH